VVLLAGLYDSKDPTRPYQIKELADTENIPVKYLEQILLALKNAGLLNSRRGLQGVYYLTKKPSEINMGQIVREVERCAGGRARVYSVPHAGGAIHRPEDVLAAIREAAQ
jgi:Rrf2 family protein